MNSEQNNSAPWQPPLLGMEFTPTIAMRNGTQRVYQCSECGTVVVMSSLVVDRKTGACPGCGHTHWWEEEIPPRGSLDSLVGCRS